MSKQQVTPELRNIFDKLYDESRTLTVIWKTCKELFAVSKEQSELLGRTANAFFQICQVTFVNEVIILLSRLTDPVKSAGKNNLCIDLLLTHMDRMVDSHFAGQLERLISESKMRCRSVSDRRNRKVSHSDLQTILNPHLKPLPMITVGEVDAAVTSIQNVMKAFSGYMFGTDILYEFLIQEGGADMLVKYLRQGEKGFVEDEHRGDLP